MAKVGGVGASKAATPEVQKIVDDIHGSVQKHCEALKDTKSGEAISFATQVVAGVNYFIKVKYLVKADTTYAHLRVYKKLGNGGIELTSVQYPKTENDPISYF